MKNTNKLILLFLSMIMSFSVMAQEEEATEESPAEEVKPALNISGSVDTYYKYDFSGYSNSGDWTSFAEDQNSFSIGMANVIFDQTVGKASFVADLAFGPRNAGSAGPGAAVWEPHIQNLYVSYAFSDVVSVTAGYMGTFVGYEIISPTGNFNYSTSYLFTNGPFQNAGLKADFAFSEKVGLMVGLFNDWNGYTDFDDIDDIGAQLSLSPVDGWDAYINFTKSINNTAFVDEFTGEVVGYDSDNMEIDLTTTYQVTDELMLGLNAALYDASADSEDGFAGAALYVNYALSDVAAIGLRYENFTFTSDLGDGSTSDLSFNAITLSGNIGSGPLKFIPEIRYDAASEDAFFDADGLPTSSAIQFVAAAVYGF